MRLKQHRLIRPFADVRSARTTGRAILGRTWLLAALLATAFAALTASAYANAPNPTAIKVDSRTVSGSSVIVTVSGKWTWDKSVPSGGQLDCNDTRSGVGVAVGWGDNTAHPLKPKNGKTRMYVGDAQDNWVHSVTEGIQTVYGPFKPSPKTVMEEMTGETPEKFGMQGISPPPGAHAAVPTKADAEKWVSNCGPTASNSNPGQPIKGYPNGTWGPISHTYTTPGPHTICPVMYDPHGHRVGAAVGSPKEIIAGGTGHNGDNSVESNNNPNPCVVTTVAQGAPVCNAGNGNATAAYNSMPFDVVNCGAPSFGFEANFTAEFGDAVQLNTTSGTLKSLSVDFQSYACGTSGHWYAGETEPCVTTPGATFTLPITAHVYEVKGTTGSEEVGTELAKVTVNAEIPYRPSADPTNCPGGESKGGRWFNTTSGKCQNSIGKLVKFEFPSGTVPADGRLIWTVSFNTSNAGPEPIGDATPCRVSGNPGCPYDSLNVGAMSYEGAPYAGEDLVEDGAWLNRNAVPALPPPASPGLHQEPGWAGFRPLGEVVTGP